MVFMVGMTTHAMDLWFSDTKHRAQPSKHTLGRAPELKTKALHIKEAHLPVFSVQVMLHNVRCQPPSTT